MADRDRIVIVEDDDDIARMLADTLTQAGMDVRTARDGAEADALLRREPADLVILDIMLPGEDGLAICRRLRSETRVSIMLLTALGEEIDRVV